MLVARPAELDSGGSVSEPKIFTQSNSPFYRVLNGLYGFFSNGGDLAREYAQENGYDDYRVIDPSTGARVEANTSAKTTASGLEDFLNQFDQYVSGLESAASAANLTAQSNATAAQTYNTSERLAAQKFNEYAYKHRYQWTYEDMKAAGINPIIGLASLGVGASPTSTPASVSAAQTFKRAENKADEIVAIAQVISSIVSSAIKAFRK